jgi:sugar lactone lactonase YvrE
MRNAILYLAALAMVTGCTRPETKVAEPTTVKPTVEIVAESERQWTGVAVTENGRIFVNFPRWWPEVPVSVAELEASRDLIPFPDDAWNKWTPEADPASTFVCVQSVVADDAGSLWILDPANPWFQGVVPGGAKLVQVDVATNQVVRVIAFDEDVAPTGSYLNDVRIDHHHQAAYVTDSGAGALVVVDLMTGHSRRLLADHSSTRAEDTVLVFEGREWLLPDGSAPQVHADGIAYDSKNDLVYYQALTGRTLYRISGSVLRDLSLDPEAVSERVEFVASSGPSDGLLWDRGDGVFISAIEEDAVRRWRPDGGVEIVIADPRIAWPDSFALGPDGGLYVTTSQIHRGPNPPEPYRVLRLSEY